MNTIALPANAWRTPDYVLFCIIMCLMGGLYWGVRGAGGFGGESGAMLAGAGWSTWWYLASYSGAGADRRPYGSVWVVPAITIGIALGGFTGYGVYISWVSGKFHYTFPDAARHINPAIGFFMLFLCGLQWGGIAGAFLAWCAPARPMSWQLWAVRIAMGIAGGALVLWWLRAYPQLHLPFYSEGIYDNPDYKDVQRTREQIKPVGQHLGIFFGFLLFELLRRDWRAVKVMLLMAFGFAIPFCVGAIWQTNYDSEWKLGWWKHWEMSIGLGGGLTFGLAFWRFNQPADAPRIDLSMRKWSSASAARLYDLFEGFMTCDGLIWLLLVNDLYGACEGRLKLHQIKLSNGQVDTIIFAGVALCTVTMFLRTRGDRWIDLRPDGNRLPLRTFTLVQGMTLFSAAMVSIPREWDLGNTVIICCYVFYLTVSAVCAWRLYEHVGDVETIPYESPAQRFRM